MPWRIRIKDRALEWLYASYTAFLGVWLAMPWDALNPRTLALLIDYVPEAWWAWGFTAIGTAHLLALVINGARWWTPFVRAGAASLNFLSFGFLVVGVTASAPGSSAVATYGYLVLGGLGIVIFRALRDCFALRDFVTSRRSRPA